MLTFLHRSYTGAHMAYEFHPFSIRDGKITLYKGKPQMVIERAEQISTR